MSQVGEEGLEATLTTDEVAELFKVKAPTVYRWAKEGIIPAQRIGRPLRFKRSDVLKTLNTTETEEDLPAKLRGVPDPTLQEEDTFISILARALVRELRRQGAL